MMASGPDGDRSGCHSNCPGLSSAGLLCRGGLLRRGTFEGGKAPEMPAPSAAANGAPQRPGRLPATRSPHARTSRRQQPRAPSATRHCAGDELTSIAGQLFTTTSHLRAAKDKKTSRVTHGGRCSPTASMSVDRLSQGIWSHEGAGLICTRGPDRWLSGIATITSDALMTARDSCRRP